MGKLKAFRPPIEIGGGLMHSYHNVAKLRQFRGAYCRQNARSTATFTRAQAAGVAQS
jgi:hypothetical protein